MRPEAEPPTYFTNLLWVGSMSENNYITNLSRQEPILARGHCVKLFCLRLSLPLVIDRNIEVTSRLSLKMPASCVFPYRVFCKNAFFVFYNSNQHPMQRQTTLVLDRLASVCHVCLLTRNNSAPETKGECQNYFICYCVVFTMFKFRKHHFLDKIYSFVIFATNFKA